MSSIVRPTSAAALLIVGIVGASAALIGCGSSVTTSRASDVPITSGATDQSDQLATARILVGLAQDSRGEVIDLHDVAVTVATGQVGGDADARAATVGQRLAATAGNLRRVRDADAKTIKAASDLAAALDTFASIANTVTNHPGAVQSTTTSSSPSSILRTRLQQADLAYRRALVALDAQVGGGVAGLVPDLPLPADKPATP